MRVVIAGGSGLIGTALSADLASDGHEVIILSRDPGRVEGLHEGTRIEPWDPHTEGNWVDVMDGADAVVNLAGANIASARWTEKRKHVIQESRLGAGRALSKAVEAVGCRPSVFVQSSGVGIYGSRGDEKLDESSSYGANFLARLAVEWESSTRRLEEIGIRMVIIRTGVVLSLKGGALPRMVSPVKWLFAGRVGSGEQWFPWIHIDDEIRAIRFLMENRSAEGAYNLVAPNPVTNACFISMMGDQLGRPLLVPLPAFVIKLVLGEMASTLLDGQRAYPSALLKLGFEFKFSEAGAALRDLLR